MRPLVLVILDGWGIRKEKQNNGIALAKKPFFDSFLKEYPNTAIDASGPAVGLPKGIMGNSEVGHMNLGAGQVVYTGLSQIYKAIDDGSFKTNPELLKAISEAKKNKSTLHLMGLVSDGAVHSHQDHLYALIQLAKDHGIEKLAIHAFMDGRDTAPSEALKYIDQLQQQIKNIGLGVIASVSGRFYAMDRDRRWDRVEKCYDVLTGAVSNGEPSARGIIEKSFSQNVTDEFIIPQAVLNDKGLPIAPMEDGDAVIFFNFRADRARQMARVLTQKNFDGFERKKFPHLSYFVCMAPYEEALHLPIAFTPEFPKIILPKILSDKGISQLRVTETEKFAHLTFFFNGGSEKVFPGEDRILIPSARDVPTYDCKPEMGAKEITEQVCQDLMNGKHDMIVVNFANSDMVGHTANPVAIIKAIEVVDACLGKIAQAVQARKGDMVITADHGNAEMMVDEKGNPHTAHTTNLVPFIVVSEKFKGIHLKESGGRLCDVAPTLLELMSLDKQGEMNGESLILH